MSKKKEPILEEMGKCLQKCVALIKEGDKQYLDNGYFSAMKQEGYVLSLEFKRTKLGEGIDGNHRRG